MFEPCLFSKRRLPFVKRKKLLIAIKNFFLVITGYCTSIFRRSAWSSDIKPSIPHQLNPFPFKSNSVTNKIFRHQHHYSSGMTNKKSFLCSRLYVFFFFWFLVFVVWLLLVFFIELMMSMFFWRNIFSTIYLDFSRIPAIDYVILGSDYFFQTKNYMHSTPIVWPSVPRGLPRYIVKWKLGLNLPLHRSSESYTINLFIIFYVF